MFLYAFSGLFAALLLSLGMNSCQHKEIGTLKADIEANKIEAARILKTAESQGKADAIKQQGDYDEALKRLSDSNRIYVGRLRDPSGARCPSTTPASPGVPESTTTGTELSDAAGKFFRGEADRADFAAVYAQECRKVALTPSIRSQVEALK